MESRRRVTRRRFLVLLAATPLAVAACGGRERASDPAASDESFASGPSLPLPAPAVAHAAPVPLENRTSAAPSPVSSTLTTPPDAVPRLASGASSEQSRVIPIPPPRSTPYTHRTLPPVRLIIPAIQLDSRVIPLGTHLDREGKLVWDTAPYAVGHHQGTANPGEAGNVVLSGHISSPNEGAIFHRLPELRVGDGVIIVTSQRYYLYRVRETKVVPPAAVDVLSATNAPTATLITCVPDGIYSHRLVVSADLV